MKYNGYEAIVEYDDIDRLFTGRVINTRDVLAFDGESVDELEESFQAVVDEYLEDCEATNKEPVDTLPRLKHDGIQRSSSNCLLRRSYIA